MNDFFDPDGPYEEDRARILRALLARAAGEGWTRAALDKAAAAAGLAPERAALVFPDGVLDALAYYSAALDRAMVAALSPHALEGLRIRERIALGLKARIEAIGEDEPAARRAASLLALPPFAPYGLKLAYRTVDTLWRAIGDTASDFNFYTKRALAAGVYLAALNAWFADRSPGKARAWATLETQIGRVMMIEGAKIQALKVARLIPSPWPLFGMLRYGEKKPASSSAGRPPNG